MGFWLLDIPHQTVKLIQKGFHNFSQRDKLKKKPFVDRYAFDLGYHSAYGLTTFAIMLNFATLVPYVTIFAGFFFAFKYNVDKYNLSFVYNSEFRGGGQIFKQVMPLSLFNIVFFQFILVAFFAIKQPRTDIVLESGLVVIAIEVLVIFIAYWRLDSRKKQRHFERRAQAKLLEDASKNVQPLMGSLNLKLDESDRASGVSRPNDSIVGEAERLLNQGKQSHFTDSVEMKGSVAGRMSQGNLKKLRNAYRHPFEYISPLLYRRNSERAESENSKLKATQIFCASEEDFNKLSMSPNDAL